MMDFITVPLVIGIITLGIYKLFELYARKKERLLMIDKLGDKLDPSYLNGSLPMPSQIVGKFSFGALKAGALMVGVGLGLLVGFLILNVSLPAIEMFNTGNYRELGSVVFGSSVLLFGGLGLLIAFIVETRINKKS